MKLFFCHACDGDQTFMPPTKGGKSRGGGEAFPQCFCIWKPWFPTSNDASPSWKGTKTHWATKSIRSHPTKYWLVNDRILYFIDIFQNFHLKKGIGLFLTRTLYKSIQRMSIGIINILNVYQLQSSPHLQVLIEVNPTASTVDPSEWGRPSKGRDKALFFFVFGASLGVLGGKIFWEVLWQFFKDVSTSITFVSPKNGHKHLLKLFHLESWCQSEHSFKIPLLKTLSTKYDIPIYPSGMK